MEPIYDRSGIVIGWIHQGRILDRSKRLRAFSTGDTVYTMRGKILGKYRKGVFEDRTGGAVAFTREASAGPFHAIPKNPTIPSVPWGIDWEDFLSA